MSYLVQDNDVSLPVLHPVHALTYKNIVSLVVFGIMIHHLLDMVKCGKTQREVIYFQEIVVAIDHYLSVTFRIRSAKKDYNTSIGSKSQLT